MSQPLWSLPHHDGSATYVPVQTPELGSTVPLLLRVPRSSDVTSAWVRIVPDGEPELVRAEVDREDENDTWLRADVKVLNRVLNYRWLLDGGTYGYQWLNQRGLNGRDVTDAFDFRLTTFPKPPSWASGTIYQIFPDRFAKSVDRPMPDWAIGAAWDDPVIGEGPDMPRQVYGGDLDGIIEHLDHIASLGVDIVYLTPCFPAETNHRYNASTFDRIDPLLGGDEAMERLATAVHARGMHLMGDLTTNHSGNNHEWFEQAIANPDGPEKDFFFFTDYPDNYDCWWGIPEFPIFNHTSMELRRRFYDGPDSVVAKWLGPKGLDAWRIDVANMTGIHGGSNVSKEVAQAVRRTMDEVYPESLLQAESNHDFTDQVLGDGYQGTMNYAAFTRPLNQWLRRSSEYPLAHKKYPSEPTLPGPLIVEAMREFYARTSWMGTLHAMNLIGSHDTMRVRSLLRDPALLDVAFGMLAAYPGAPMIYAGDELGLEAEGPEYARLPMPWDKPDSWESHRLAHTRAVYGARAESEALLHGGLRWLSVTENALTFLREAPEESVLVHAARGRHTPVRVPASVAGSQLTGLAGTPDLAADSDGFVTLPPEGPKFSMWRC